jgi:polyisoprenoid-binding protein YceI
MAGVMSTGESGKADAVVRYTLDDKRSRFTAHAFAGGMLSALGHSPTIAIREFSGEVECLPGSLDMATLRLSIAAASFRVADDVSDKDRNEMERAMREEVLETDRFPKVIYESTSVSSVRIFEGQYRVNIMGKLSLHGVKRDCPVTAQLILSDDFLRASGEFTLLQTDYRIKPYSAVGGAIKLKDQLKFSFDLVGRIEDRPG